MWLEKNDQYNKKCYQQSKKIWRTENRKIIRSIKTIKDTSEELNQWFMVFQRKINDIK